jgi:hypothetical protein
VNNFIDMWQHIFVAAAFAEAGESETAREIMKEEKKTEGRESLSPRKDTRASTPHLR